MPARTPVPARARGRRPASLRSSPASPRPIAWPHLPALDQRQLDLLGLGLVALAAFFGLVIYLGWEGGRAGSAAVEGLRWLLGEVHYVVPVALVAAGAILVLRPVLPAVRPFRSGGLCLFAALTLWLAGSGERPAWWDPAWVKRHGGMLGEALDWVASSLVGDVGAHILAIFLLLAAILLLTGASVAGVLKATGSHVTQTTRVLRDSSSELRTAVQERRRGATAELAALEATGEGSVTVAEPPEFEPGKPARKPRRAKSFLDGEDSFPDLYGGAVPEMEAEEDPMGAVEAPHEAEPEPEADEDRVGAIAASHQEDEPEPGEPREFGHEPLAPEGEPEAELDSESPPGRLAEDPPVDEPGVMRAPVDPSQLTPQGRYRAEVTESPDFLWSVPDAGFLTRSSGDAARPDTAGQQKVAAQLIEALGHFGVQARVIGMVAGPHITRYELRLAPGIKVGKVAQLKDDLAYALAASDIRILAPIPGKQAVGVEVPNARRRIVHLGDVLQAPPEGWSPLTVWLGKDVAGRAIGADLAKMPHLLVAGTTGAGKSGCVNAMLSSILLRATPHEVRMVLVDPKQVELTHYDSIPHLLTPVITSPRQAATALQNLVREMEQRYSYMAVARTRTLNDLNAVRERRGDAPLPYILCVIDELADLMMVAPADVEDSIIRIAQKARAVGIHLVLATQSPRVDVITGMIKANVPSRIAFAVSSQTDSRVILDQNGAEALLGMGDMLFAPVGSSRLQRIQGAFIDEGQIAELTESWRRQGEPELREDLLEAAEDAPEEAGAGEEGFDPDEDPLLEDAIRLVAEMQTASTSMLQRRLRLGYTRAGRLIDMLERRGVISGYEGSKPRQVLVTEADLPRVLAALGEAQAVPGDGD
jgi:DNA segregation ATPase FtsK/SpoIIIE, S-DNA-T family